VFFFFFFFFFLIGCFFLDRDPTHFQRILNFMRTGVLIYPPDETSVAELKIEVQFYQIRPLIKEMKLKGEGRLFLSCVLFGAFLSLSLSLSRILSLSCVCVCFFCFFAYM
jgi:fumarate reductase subunit C